MPNKRKSRRELLLAIPASACFLTSCFKWDALQIDEDAQSEFGFMMIRPQGPSAVTAEGARRTFPLFSVSGRNSSCEVVTKFEDSAEGFFQGLVGASVDGRYLAAQFVTQEGRSKTQYIDLIDLVGMDNIRLKMRLQSESIQVSSDGATIVTMHRRSKPNDGESIYPLLQVRINGEVVRQVESSVSVYEGLHFCLASDGKELLYTNAEVVMRLNFASERRDQVARGRYVSCPATGGLFSYVTHDDTVVMESLLDRSYRYVSNMRSRDGVLWSPDGTCGLISQRSHVYTLMNRLNDIGIFFEGDERTRVLFRVGSSVGTRHFRWLKNIAEVPVRLHRWLEVNKLGFVEFASRKM